MNISFWVLGGGSCGIGSCGCIIIDCSGSFLAHHRHSQYHHKNHHQHLYHHLQQTFYIPNYRTPTTGTSATLTNTVTITMPPPPSIHYHHNQHHHYKPTTTPLIHQEFIILQQSELPPSHQMSPLPTHWAQRFVYLLLVYLFTCLYKKCHKYSWT